MTPDLYAYAYRMVGWFDGDSATIDIDLGFGNWMMGQKVRLYGVNTPELRGDEREKGIRVRNIVREWAPFGSTGILRSHKDKSGKYGRWLGEIYPDGWERSINARLYQEGLAKIEAYSARDRIKIEIKFSREQG